eukprot:13543637-Ditylum_brightwellii.AAC.1
MFKKEKFDLQFIAFKQVAKWPLEENYSKWVLATYKPWRGSIDSSKLEDSFSKQLVQYMWNKSIPLQIILDIVRRKNSFTSDLSVTNIFNGEFAHTPTDEMERQMLNTTKPNDIDWSEGYVVKYESWLDNYATKFYSDLNNALHDESEVKLYMED